MEWLIAGDRVKLWLDEPLVTAISLLVAVGWVCRDAHCIRRGR